VVAQRFRRRKRNGDSRSGGAGKGRERGLWCPLKQSLATRAPTVTVAWCGHSAPTLCREREERGRRLVGLVREIILI
jgi:hypothetical protein